MVNLPFLKKTGTALKKFLTVDINANDIKCLAFYQDNGTCKIVGAGIQPVEPGCVRAGVIIDKDAVAETLAAAAGQAMETLGEPVDKAIFGISGSTCLGLTTTVRSRRPQRILITKKELDEISERIGEAAYIQAENEFLQSSGNADTELEIITTASVYSKLDGQLVPDLENREGSLIETAVFNAFTPKYQLKSLQQVARKSGLDILAVGSEMYSLSQQLKYSLLENTDYVLLNITNDETNAAVVFGRGIVSTKNLNIGLKHFIEGISERMGITTKEAEKILSGYIANNLSSSESQIIQNILRELLEIWVGGLELLFNEFSGVKTFAPRVYITGEGAIIPEVLEAITNEPWTKSIPFKAIPDFRKLSFSDLPRMSDATGKAHTAEWIAAASLSVIYSEMMGTL
jgi:cell division ATPase FtsA